MPKHSLLEQKTDLNIRLKYFWVKLQCVNNYLNKKYAWQFPTSQRGNTNSDSHDRWSNFRQSLCSRIFNRKLNFFGTSISTLPDGLILY